MSVDSSRKKQGQVISATSSSQAARRSSHRVKRALRATIEEYMLDHRSQNHSPKTIEWHTLALGNFAAFLEKKGVSGWVGWRNQRETCVGCMVSCTTSSNCTRN